MSDQNIANPQDSVTKVRFILNLSKSQNADKMMVIKNLRLIGKVIGDDNLGSETGAQHIVENLFGCNMMCFSYAKVGDFTLRKDVATLFINVFASLKFFVTLEEVR